MKAFEVGNIYEMRFIGDFELRPHFICTKRTPKTASFKGLNTGEIINRRIKISDEGEYVVDGSYSMAPTIRAKRVVG